jgi:hypothetical protein
MPENTSICGCGVKPIIGDECWGLSGLTKVVRAGTELVLAGLAEISCTLSPAFQNEYGLNSVTGWTRVITMKG